MVEIEARSHYSHKQHTAYAFSPFLAWNAHQNTRAIVLIAGMETKNKTGGESSLEKEGGRE